jgi:cytochrome c peroxidase
LKSVEDFTGIRAAGGLFRWRSGDRHQEGREYPDRGSQVHDMAEFQELLDFPPAPKLTVLGKLDPAKASPAELRGQEVFFGKGQCAACHTPPFYTDNLMHNLQVERFFKPVTINNMLAGADGPIKTFPLRGIKDSPPYLHDGRLLTLEDTVEFFNLVLGTKLTQLIQS